VIALAVAALKTVSVYYREELRELNSEWETLHSF
jgi:hypothetical protein